MNETLSETRQQLAEMLRQKSVRTGDFTLASGQKSDLYVDCRLTTLDCHGARWIGELGWAALQHKLIEDFPSVRAIGGMTMGADPISLAVGMESARQDAERALQVFTVRKEPKGHGRGRQIEGNFNEGDEVVVVDDVITTGGSTCRAIEVLREAGGVVRVALVLVDREEGGREAIEALGVPVVALFTRSQLLD